ncbi:hypothetical protein MVEN_00820500 [Mycena venus]|uniref:Uncharacterized protein n=1 Tax=Mycena venus TaxID=2733690 RepID=A0A8H7D3L2_9AGAR|nr:hypothetical protein MVEN_00820500 [Mycena venus]
MQLPFSVLFALVLSLDTLAAPLPNADAGEVALNARAKVAASKPVAKPVAKPAAVKPVAKPAVVPAKAPAAAVPAKAPVAAKPAAVNTAKPATVPIAAKPATVPAKAPIAVKPAAGNTAKPAAVPAKAPVAAVAPAVSAKPSALPKCTAAQIEARELEELDVRSHELEARVFGLGGGITHPDAAGTITLFHGTTAANAAALAAGSVDLSRTRGTGDFNHFPEVPGGFYLTDSLVAAGQFACFGIPGSRPATADVVEYRWTGAGRKTFTFPGETADWLAFQQFNNNPNKVVVTTGPFAAKAAQLFTNDMIAGPLNGPSDFLLTDDFQQYAVISQNAATNGLQFVARHQNIICDNIPTGNGLTARLYQQGQAGNAKFNTRLAKLQDPNFRPGNGLCVFG